MDETLGAVIKLKDQFTEPLRNIMNMQNTFGNNINSLRNTLSSLSNEQFSIDIENDEAIQSINEVVSNNENISSIEKQRKISVENKEAIERINAVSEHAKNISKPVSIIVKIKDYITRQTEIIKDKLKNLGRIITRPVIAIKDFATDKLNKINGHLKSIGQKIVTAVIKVKDMAFKPLVKVYGMLTGLGKMIITPVIKIKDLASKSVTKVKSLLLSIVGNRGYEAILRAKDMASRTISNVSGKLKSFGKGSYQAITKVKDMASSVLSGIGGKLTALAGGITIAVVAKVGIEGLGAEQTQKITINRVIENSGKSKKEAQKATEDYYKYLEDFANKTPFETSEVATFGTKAAMIAKGNIKQAKVITDSMANVKAFVGDLRTSTEVAEAFFSASNGNMDMLNNMLGSQYKDMNSALKGIAKNQGGLVDEMANTIPGLMSTISGKLKVSAKNIVKNFQPMLEGLFSGIISGIDTFMPIIDNSFGRIASFITDLMNGDSSNFKIIENLINSFNFLKSSLEPVFSILGEQFTNVSTIINDKFGGVGTFIESVASVISNAISNLTPILSLISPIFELIAIVAQTVWPIIQDVITVASTIIGGLMETLAPVFSRIVEVVTLIGSTVSSVWPTIQETIMNVWNNLQPVLSLFQTIANGIADIFVSLWPGISSAVETVWSIVGPIFETMSSILGKVAEMAEKVVNGIGNAVNAVKNSKLNPFNWFGGNKHAYGLQRVPYNNYPAVLHEGEMVLTKQQANQYNNTIKANKNDVGRSMSDGIKNIQTINSMDYSKKFQTTSTNNYSEYISKPSNISTENKKVVDTKNYSSKQNINFNISSMVVREEADIDKIADKFVEKLEAVRINFAGDV